MEDLQWQRFERVHPTLTVPECKMIIGVLIIYMVFAFFNLMLKCIFFFKASVNSFKCSIMVIKNFLLKNFSNLYYIYFSTIFQFQDILLFVYLKNHSLSELGFIHCYLPQRCYSSGLLLKRRPSKHQENLNYYFFFLVQDFYVFFCSCTSANQHQQKNCI